MVCIMICQQFRSGDNGNDSCGRFVSVFTVMASFISCFQGKKAINE